MRGLSGLTLLYSFNLRPNELQTTAVVLNSQRVNPYSAGIDFSRQNLTTVDVRFLRLKSILALLK